VHLDAAAAQAEAAQAARAAVGGTEAGAYDGHAEGTGREKPPLRETTKSFHTLALVAMPVVGDGACTEADRAYEVWVATEEEPVPLLCVVIDASGILGADASGLRVLRSIIDEHHKRSPPVEMMLASTKGPLRMSLRKAGE
jgi:hypothetical protein